MRFAQHAPHTTHHEPRATKMKYAICNETFQNWDHKKVCEFVAEEGYVGLELAPFTFCKLVTDLSDAQLGQIRSEVEEAGLHVVGLHWLLAHTEGFQLTAPDEDGRQRCADYLVELAKCCRELGGSLMVFGSPMQRKIPEGATKEQATDYATDTLQRALPGIAETGINFCLEPLAPTETDFIQTADEAVEILDRLNHPQFLLHLDVKAMSSESTSIPEIIHKHKDRIGHFHANDPNMRGPGFGDVDFVPIFKALHEVDYQGWVSVEVFDYTPDPETIARKSIRYMRECNTAQS